MSSRNTFMAWTSDSYKVVKPKICTIYAYTTHSLHLIREKAAFTIPKLVGSCYLAIFNIFLFKIHLAANLDFFFSVMRLSAHYKAVQALQYGNKTTLNILIFSKFKKWNPNTNKMLQFIPKVDITQICHSTSILKDILESFRKTQEK